MLLGDLALRHDISGLVAANEMSANLDVVCVDNSGGGIFHLLPISHHREAFETYFATPQRTNLSRLITGTGAEAVYVESADALSRVLDEPVDGVRVIVAVVDRESSVQSRSKAINRAVQAVDSAFLSVGSEGLR